MRVQVRSLCPHAQIQGWVELVDTVHDVLSEREFYAVRSVSDAPELDLWPADEPHGYEYRKVDDSGEPGDPTRWYPGEV